MPGHPLTIARAGADERAEGSTWPHWPAEDDDERPADHAPDLGSASPIQRVELRARCPARPRLHRGGDVAKAPSGKSSDASRRAARSNSAASMRPMSAGEVLEWSTAAALAWA